MAIKIEKNQKRKDGNSTTTLNVKKKPDYFKKVISLILFVMASLLTCCSLYMVGMTAFKRAATSGEAVIIAGVAMCVALSAHILPALVKGRQSVKVYSLISIIWLACVSATLYSHTLFFVTTQNEKADERSANSPEVQNLQDLIKQKEQWINSQQSRSLNDINISIANEQIRIDQLTPRACDKCTTIKARINAYQARKAAFEDEKQVAQNIADQKQKVMAMQEQVLNTKSEQRTDPVFERISKIIPGMSYDVFNLSSAITNALLLEILATLFWWLLLPHKKENINEEKKSDQLSLSPFKSKNKNKSYRFDDRDMIKGSVEDEDDNIDFVEAEIVEDPNKYFEVNGINKAKSKSLVDFTKRAFETSRQNDNFVIYNGNIYDTVVEDIFLQRIVLSIIKKENIVELDILNAKSKIQSEDLITHTYVNKIKKNEVLSEDFVLMKYVSFIYKNTIREDSDQYSKIPFFKEDNDEIIPYDEMEKIKDSEENYNHYKEIEKSKKDLSLFNTDDLIAVDGDNSNDDTLNRNDLPHSLKITESENKDILENEINNNDNKVINNKKTTKRHDSTDIDSFLRTKNFNYDKRDADKKKKTSTSIVDDVFLQKQQKENNDENNDSLQKDFSDIINSLNNSH